MNNLENRMQKLFWIVGLGLIMAILAATTGCGESKRTQEQLLKRADAYWEAWRINDLHTVYEMEAAAVEGRMRPDQLQRPSGRIRLVGYEFRDVKVEGDNAYIVVDREITIPEFEGKSVSGPSTIDRWTFINGDWYHGLSAASLEEAKDAEPDKTGKP